MELRVEASHRDKSARNLQTDVVERRKQHPAHAGVRQSNRSQSSPFREVRLCNMFGPSSAIAKGYLLTYSVGFTATHAPNRKEGDPVCYQPID